MSSDVKERVSAPGANVSRRSLIKAAGLTAGASAFSLYFPAVHAAEAGTIRIGWIAAVPGPGALFGEAVPFVKAQLDKIFAGGLEIGGKRYSVEILLRDSQSSINVATQAVTELINRQKVDLIVAPEPDRRERWREPGRTSRAHNGPPCSATPTRCGRSQCMRSRPRAIPRTRRPCEAPSPRPASILHFHSQLTVHRQDLRSFASSTMIQHDLP